MEQWKKYNIGEVITTNVEQLSAKDNWKQALYLDTGNITENVTEDIQELPIPKLAKTRDTLLPKLMSGEVKINDVNV